MSALLRARDRLAGRFEAFARSAGAGEPHEPAWLARLRREALAAFRERGLPTPRDEEWRYTNLAALAQVDWTDPPPSAPPPDRQAIEALAFPVYACSYFVFVNGRYREDLSAPRSLSGEVRVDSLARLRHADPQALEGVLGELVDPKTHPFSALNTAFFEDGALLRLPRGAEVSSPIHLIFVSTPGAAPALCHPRVAILAEPGSRGTVIQDHVSIGRGAAFTNAVTELLVGADARLEFVLLQREDDLAFHVSGLFVRVGRDAALTSHVLSLGGRLVRNDLSALLSEPGAECTLRGLFLGTGDRIVDNHTLVDHAVPHGTSRELYKGVLGGRSRGVFRGRVIVRPHAQKTNATQSNPNLLLSDAAEIDTKPQLEIHADDVRCSHGSSIGQVDPEALFYLRARGLRERQARDLLTRGFAQEIATALPSTPLAERVSELLLERLGEDEEAPR